MDERSPELLLKGEYIGVEPIESAVSITGGNEKHGGTSLKTTAAPVFP
jgi:hypothetical protein